MKKKLAVKVLVVCIAVCIVAEAALILCVHYTATKAYTPEKRDVAIVLGARVMPDGELSTTLEHRIEKGLEVYRAGWADKLIVCGAQGGDEPTTEAAAMREYLLNHDVPDTDIFMEDKSASTEENLDYAMAIMAQNGLRTAIVVTSDYHVRRALWLSEDAGLDAIGAPAKGPDLLHNQWIARFKESLSWIKYWVTHRL